MDQEWEMNGKCSGLTARDYFGFAIIFFGKFDIMSFLEKANFRPSVTTSGTEIILGTNYTYLIYCNEDSRSHLPLSAVGICFGTYGGFISHGRLSGMGRFKECRKTEHVIGDHETIKKKKKKKGFKAGTRW